MGATISWLNSANQRSMCVSSVRNPHDQNKEADLDSRRVLEELDEEGDVLESLLVVRFTNNVVVILASGVRQRRLLRSAAPHALANSAGLVE